MSSTSSGIVLLQEPLHLEIKDLKEVIAALPKGMGVAPGSIQDIDGTLTVSMIEMTIGIDQLAQPIPPQEFAEALIKANDPTLADHVSAHQAILAVAAISAENAQANPMRANFNKIAFLALAHQLGARGKPLAFYSSLTGEISHWEESMQKINSLGGIVFNEFLH